MVAADLVLQDMANAGTDLNIVVLDACRNNPFAMAGADANTRGLRPRGTAPGGGRAGGGRADGGRADGGLAEMHAPRGTLISFATQPGSVAYDGAAGAPDSPYTTALAGTLRVPGLDVVSAFNRAGLEVGRLTAQKQEPWLAISPLEDQVFLAGPSANAATAQTASLPAEPIVPMVAERSAQTPRAAPPQRSGHGLSCPAAGLQAVRNGSQQVRYEGAEPGAPDICIANVAGAQQALAAGIWPANWPGSAAAASALRRVLAGPPGSTASFELSADVEGIRDTVTSEGWQFVLTNEGPAEMVVGGEPLMVQRVQWQERNLARPYMAQATVTLDSRTGAVLRQSFRVLVGGSAASYDFWSRYQGGLGAVPDFRVTALN